jgi:hypothetical protein
MPVATPCCLSRPLMRRDAPHYDGIDRTNLVQGNTSARAIATHCLWLLLNSCRKRWAKAVLAQSDLFEARIDRRFCLLALRDAADGTRRGRHSAHCEAHQSPYLSTADNRRRLLHYITYFCDISDLRSVLIQAPLDNLSSLFRSRKIDHCAAVLGFKPASQDKQHQLLITPTFIAFCPSDWPRP